MGETIVGIRILRGTDVYDFVSTCIPMESEINTVRIQNEYRLSTVKSSMQLLGSMCDYGVRSYFPMRAYAYLELSMIMSRPDDVLDALLSQFCLTANEAYAMVRVDSAYKSSKLSEDIVRDYDNLVLRAIDLFNCFNLTGPVFGAYFRVKGRVHSFECDCIDWRTVLDLKVSVKEGHVRDYWIQLLFYSLLLYMCDGKVRNVVGVIRPVQGIIQYFKYPKDQYYCMFKRFSQLYEEVS